MAYCKVYIYCEQNSDRMRIIKKFFPITSQRKYLTISHNEICFIYNDKMQVILHKGISLTQRGVRTDIAMVQNSLTNSPNWNEYHRMIAHSLAMSGIPIIYFD